MSRSEQRPAHPRNLLVGYPTTRELESEKAPSLLSRIPCQTIPETSNAMSTKFKVDGLTDREQPEEWKFLADVLRLWMAISTCTLPSAHAGG